MGCEVARRVDFDAPRPHSAFMADETSAQTEGIVTLTPRAVEAVRETRSREGLSDAHVLRVSVIGGGCSGFSYQLTFDEQAAAEDTVFEYDGVRVAIDPT